MIAYPDAVVCHYLDNEIVELQIAQPELPAREERIEVLEDPLCLPVKDELEPRIMGRPLAIL